MRCEDLSALRKHLVRNSRLLIAVSRSFWSAHASSGRFRNGSHSITDDERANYHVESRDGKPNGYRNSDTSYWFRKTGGDSDGKR